MWNPVIDAMCSCDPLAPLTLLGQYQRQLQNELIYHKLNHWLAVSGDWPLLLHAAGLGGAGGNTPDGPGTWTGPTPPASGSNGRQSFG